MDQNRKITVVIPAGLLEQAQEASGAGVAQTVRTGLELVAASRAFGRLRSLRGAVEFSRTWQELKANG